MRTTLPSAVSIVRTQKNYGSLTALQGIDLEIPQGEFFGLLGPNGAGKSTLIHCIMGLARPSSGEVRVFGHSVQADPLSAKMEMGFSPQEVNVERFFNLRRTLEFQGGFYGLSREESKNRAQQLLEQFGLVEKASEQFFRLSGGMQKRLLVARAMMSKPRLLILDEPTAGVDVGQRHELWKYLKDLNRDGTTILLTTHYIDEAEALCERVGIINHGKILELGSPQNLVEKYCRSQIHLTLEGTLDAEEFRGIPEVCLSGQEIRAETQSLGITLEKILSVVLSRPGRRLKEVQVRRGNLEEVFLKVTGKTLEEVEQGSAPSNADDSTLSNPSTGNRSS